MIDIDDYLIIKNNTLINYLSEETFEKCDFIKIHLFHPSSKNKPLFERIKTLFNTYIRTFVRGNINNLHYDIHTPSESLERNISCNNAGQILNYSQVHQDVFEFNYDKAYIIHFINNSTKDYIKTFEIDHDHSNWFDRFFTNEN